MVLPDDQRFAPNPGIDSHPAQQDMRIRVAGSLPSEATFSRAFATFAAGRLGIVAHYALVTEYLSHELIDHISRDATVIVGREKPVKKAANEPKLRRKQGRPAKGEQRETAPLKRLDRQMHQTFGGHWQLPTVCDRGTK